MRTWSKVFGGFVIFLIAAVVGVFVVLSNADLNQFKSPIVNIVEKATGRTLHINGDLELAVSLSPTLRIQGVQMSNATWGRDEPMVTLDRLDAKIALAPLFSGQLEFDYIEIHGLNVLLQTDGNGLANWEFGTVDQGTSVNRIEGDGFALNPEVRDVRLRDIHVRYVDGALQKEMTMDLASANFNAATFDSPLSGDVALALNGVGFEGRVLMGSLAQVIAPTGPAFPVNLALAGDGVSLSLDGTIGQPRAGMEINAKVFASADESEVLGQIAGIDVPALDDLSVEATISGQGTRYRFSDVSAIVGDSDIAGDVSVDFSQSRPFVSAKLASRILDLGPLLENADTSERNDDGSLFSSVPLSLERLRTVDGNIELSAGVVRVAGTVLNTVDARVKLSDATLTVAPIELRFGGGRVASQLTVDAKSKTPHLQAHMSLRGVDVDAIASAFGFGGVLLMPLEGEFDIEAQGRSPNDMARTANGYGRLIGRNGTVRDKQLQRLAAGASSIVPWASNKDANGITCALVKMPIKDGVATAEHVVIDTKGVRVDIGGYAVLADEELDFVINTKAKNVSLASLAVPLRIKGSFQNPDVQINPAEAVVGTVGNVVKVPLHIVVKLLTETLTSSGDKDGVGQNDPCLQLSSKVKTTPEEGVENSSAPATTNPASQSPKPSSESEPDQDAAQDISKSSGDPVKDFNKVSDALKNLF